MTLLLAMLLDAVAGEPRWLWSRLPHPAVLMGRAVGWADTRFNTGDQRKLKGVATYAGLLFVALALGMMLQAIPGTIIDILIGAILLAHRSLIQHLQAVADDLRISLGDGRRAVAMIVSRDTKGMDETSVARSAIESGAENFSDGVTAPLFWFAIAGLPGLLAYKITNTADSMIGYRTPRYRDFGWAAARADDLLNLIPARLTALLLALVTPNRPMPHAVIRDARLHRSPNAGWPESAIAHGHDVALAGPRSYDGALQDFPFVNTTGRRDLGSDDIDATIASLWKAWRSVAIISGIAAIVSLS